MDGWMDGWMDMVLIYQWFDLYLLLSGTSLYGLIFQVRISFVYLLS